MLSLQNNAVTLDIVSLTLVHAASRVGVFEMK